MHCRELFLQESDALTIFNALNMKRNRSEYMYRLPGLFFSGLRKLMFQYFTFGVGEYYRGIIKSAQVKQLQRYIPSLKVEDVVRYGSKCR